MTTSEEYSATAPPPPSLPPAPVVAKEEPMSRWYKDLVRCPLVREVAVLLLTAALRALGSSPARR